MFPIVRAEIDADEDGVLSEREQEAYAGDVVRDLSLAVDGAPLPLRIVSARFADVEELREGMGAITLVLDTRVAPGGTRRRLVFENRHMRGIGVYLVNGLVPADPAILAGRQRRNEEQSRYELDYVQRDAASIAQPSAYLATPRVSARAIWLGGLGVTTLLVMVARLATGQWRSVRGHHSGGPVA